jgi:hypothetical protein
VNCLDNSSMRLGVPFIAPRQLGAVVYQQGRLSCLLSRGAPDISVRHRTGPVDGPVRDCLPNWAQMTVAAPGPLAHWTLSGAPCRPLELPRVTRRLRGRPLALATVGSPDSPVNFSHVAPLLFPRATSSPRMTHRAIRCTTGPSGDL